VIIKPLWSVHSYPGLANSAIHFTGRITGEPNGDVAASIADQTPPERLVAILTNRFFRAHHPYWSAGEPTICFTEAPQLGVERLIRAKRYAPWAVGFDKQFIFDNDGGPAFYVRGDQWEAYRTSGLPARLKAFGTPYWPGADPGPGEGPLPTHLATTSQWYHEREWRVPRPEDQRNLAFTLDDIRFLVVPGQAALDWLCEQVPGLIPHMAHIRVMHISEPDGPVVELEETAYDWTDPYDPANPDADLIKEILGLD
jgi:hypothetical protein